MTDWQQTPGTDTPVVNVTYFKYVQIAGGTQTGKTFTKSAKINCDICHKTDLTTFIDGNTKLGGWANMCPACHKKYGFGIGIGKGQKYELTDSENHNKPSQQK